MHVFSVNWVVNDFIEGVGNLLSSKNWCKECVDFIVIVSSLSFVQRATPALLSIMHLALYG